MLSFAQSIWDYKSKCVFCIILCHAIRHIFKKGNTHRSEQLQIYANSASTKRRAYLSLFLLHQHTAPGRNVVSRCVLPLLVLTFTEALSPLYKGLLALHESSLFASFFVTGRERLL